LETPQVPGYTEAQRGWFYNAEAEAEQRQNLISSSFMWELIRRGVAGEGGVEAVCRRYNLYDALAIEYRANFAPKNGGVVTPELVERFVGTFESPVIDASAPLAKVGTARSDGAPASKPLEHTYYFQDPGVPRRDADEASSQTTLGDLIKTSLSSGKGAVAGTPGRFVRVTLHNRIHGELFSEPERFLDDYWATELPIHARIAVKRAHEIERTARAQRRLGRRYLDTEVVRLLEHGPELRDMGQLIALDLMPTEADPDNPTSRRRIYSLEVTAGGRKVQEPLGSTDDPAAAIIAALQGPASAEVRPAIRALMREAWPKFEQENGGPDGARATRDEKVWAYTFPDTGTGVDTRDLALAIAILATEDV
jgi:hypothetical protein